MNRNYFIQLDKAIRTPEENESFYRSMLGLILSENNGSADGKLIEFYLDLIEGTRESKS